MVQGVMIVMPITTTEEKAQRRLKLLEAIAKRFGGNAATKKTQRNLLKQQYENFTTTSSEMLDHPFDRLQKLVSQLELLDEKLSLEDVNQKLLRSLSLEWNTHAIVAPRNQDNKNKESSRRIVPVETPTFIALVSCDGLSGYDWHEQVEEGPNYALMAFLSPSSDSKVSNDSICSKSCLETVELLKSQNGQLLKDLRKSYLDEFVNKPVVKNSKAMSSEEKPKNLVPRAVLMKSGLVSVNTATQVNVAHSKTTVNAARRMHKGDILLVQVYVDDIIFGSTKKKLCNAFKKLMHEKFQMISMGELTFFFGITKVKTASTLMETQKPLLKDENGKKVDVHMYRSMIDSLMYLTSSRPDIMFAVCACARYQVNLKVSHLYAVKRIFRYLKGQLKLDLWYPKDSPFDLVAYTDSDYVGSSLDRKSTTGGKAKKNIRLMMEKLFGMELEELILAKTINGEVQLHALVDGKKIIVTESTVRIDLQLEDVEEKKYPIIPSTLTMILEKKLQIDYESEMAYQLLKSIIKQLKKIKSLLDAVWITAAHVFVNTAHGVSTAQRLQ
ncbi:uncharacterized mitochondrial protein-like protein [Tanacetum coccineum]